jgi:hypothetical protein
VGIVFVIIGIYWAINVFPSKAPWIDKAIIALWTFVAAGICLYHVANIVSSRGVANEVIDVDPTTSVPSAEQRLQRLMELRAKQLISEEEYQKQRTIVINGI